MPKPNKNGGGGNTGGTTPPAGAITGSAFADVLSGTAGDDILWSLEGDDEVFGLGGNDTIEGGAGNDTIDGGAGDDVLNGGDGADLFIGSAGSDTIDGGGGTNAVIYYAQSETDYTITAITEISGRGRKQVETIVGYEVLANDGSGDLDVITNVSSVTVVVLPPNGTITTQGDFAFVDRDGTVTINVLDNDYIEGGTIGQGLTLTALSDIQLDVDGDGNWDTDFIDETQPLSYYAAGGLLADGSILTVATDGTMTWDPNDVYDVDPGTTPSISFWYEATDGVTTEYGDVTFAVTYPAPAGDITFETMTPAFDPITATILGYNNYYDGPGGSYVISQLTTATNWFELRDVDAAGDYDYDNDGDDEFRVWTDADGTTHEMNVTEKFSQPFDLGGMTIIGLDVGEVATFIFADASGQVTGTATVTEADLSAGGLLEFTNATNVAQFSVEAGVGDEFYIDDIFFV